MDAAYMGCVTRLDVMIVKHARS